MCKGTGVISSAPRARRTLVTTGVSFRYTLPANPLVDDTGIGGSSDFPRTRRSAIVAAGSSDPIERTRAFDALISAYWKPSFRHLRLKWRKNHEDAKDLTQAFFGRAMEKGWFDSFDPSKARFRTFLRTCLDGFVQNEAKAQGRIKRGGGERILSLDFERAEGELAHVDPAAPDSVDREFDEAWVRGLFASAIDQLRNELAAAGRVVNYQLLVRYDLERRDDQRITYDDLAREHGISVTDVTNRLAFARRELRRVVLDRLRAITSTDREFREEARLVLGLDPP